jgi:molecular chaperone HtpG
MSEKNIEFKTEVQQLLDLMIHSVYSNKDIFLRELVANASDAIDKARFEALTKPELTCDWAVKIEADKKNKTLKISDNGVGMTEEEVVRDIGTIARSGTKEYFQALKGREAANVPELIGQFGVGFYSAFMVADKIEIVTKKINSSAPAVKWVSEGKASFTVDETSKDSHGTDIILHLKSEADTYLEDWKIREIVKKYSDFIEHPVKLLVTKKSKEGAETSEFEIINSQKAIWLRPEKDVTEDEYKQFYGHLSHSDSDPMRRIHYSAEGASEFKALLFIPSKAPFDIFFPEQRKKGIHLYIKRVFITDNCPGLIPEYMRFLNGVVDSSDLPLNISREMLQDNPEILKINKNIVRRVLSELKDILEKDREKYNSFYKEFGRLLKEGAVTDFANKEKIQDLLLFETMSGGDGKLVSLKEYFEKMPVSQKEIYYIIGENRAFLENSPHLELLKKKNFDVLFMTEPVDEWVVQHIREYSGKKLKSVDKGDIELDDDSKKEFEKEKEEASKKHGTLLEFFKKALAEKISDARFSPRLTESPCCLVSNEFDPGAHMERVLKALNQKAPHESKRILELNPSHPLVDALQKLHDKDPASAGLADYAETLFDMALLTEGSPIANPLKFSKRVADLMTKSMDR